MSGPPCRWWCEEVVCLSQKERLYSSHPECCAVWACLDAGWGQFKLSMLDSGRSAVVRTYRLLRCDRIPGLWSSCERAAPSHRHEEAANQPHPRRKFARQNTGENTEGGLRRTKSLVFGWAICKYTKPRRSKLFILGLFNPKKSDAGEIWEWRHSRPDSKLQGGGVHFKAGGRKTQMKAGTLGRQTAIGLRQTQQPWRVSLKHKTLCLRTQGGD